ncbi:glycine--tRNA ligase subunit beta [Frigidibacter sp. ROC022]|uniref:glycine--tRNA ligase subunit beta n=1 Tax=Frigidibacter sp. ROC022 TaxID=2971796 RepID=UPI00215ADA66|nr:glycine--tRNA ligase subunit beta [Frigidibacter sp. ROC022]MCR8726364.1 glycine--tRNA ligase subunit beta [Frigidibacter sp. ROC022]
MPDLLIELFSEEIPARMQARASDDLKRLMTDGLVAAGLTYDSAGAFATPRRLALSVEGLTARSQTVREERKGPRVGAPEAAIEGFLRGAGVTRDQLTVKDTGKGEAWFAVVEKPGREAAEIIAEVLEATIRNFPWPKSMRWGAGTLRWVRPLHSILCLLSDESGATVVPLSLDGLTAGDTTEGHRFHAPDRFSVTSFDDYRAKLKRAYVLLDPTERAEHIWHDASQQAFAQGLELVEDKGLLTEVAGLVEWPVVLMGAIDESFLGLPPEVLQTSMKEHQKFFSVRNPKTGRIEKFITVANRETRDHGATILAGNQKVLSARLSDAKFFYDNDLRVVRTEGLEGMAKGLADVTFHNKLGSQAERVQRIEALAREIAPLVGAAPDLAAEAARICKADLQSEMVGEFPELQGLMGRYYATEAGHDDGVPEACEMHYKPLGPSDEVPSSPVSVAVALADKIDTLTGFWAIEEKPTGSKDPFALRRAALGVIRLVLENQVRASIQPLLTRLVVIHYLNSRLGEVETAQVSLRDVQSGEITKELAAKKTIEILGTSVPEAVADELSARATDLLAFFHDRLKVYLRDRGIPHDVIDACLAMPNNDDLTLLVKRAEALAAFLKTDDGENLLQGFKRANNIVSQAEEKDGVEYSYGADIKFAEDASEKALFSALDAAEEKIAPAMQAEDFSAAMEAMAALRAPLDAFFEAVQVNTDNEVQRRNRLNLLNRIRRLCLSVADLTRVEG